MLLTLALLSGALANNIISLNGEGWTLTSPGNSSINVPAQVPSQNYLDLQAGGIVADPIYGFQEDEQSWVRYSNWTYTSPAITGLSANTTTQLVFEGLDGYAAVYLCEEQIGNTDNQYVQWTFDITSVLASCQGDIKLELNFGPAQNITHDIGRTATGTSAGNVNFADGCNDKPGNEFSCKAWARKEQSDFGWDWSPHLIPTGPWRNISIVQIDSVYINNALIDVYRQGQQNNLPPDQSQPWVFNASLDFLGSLPSGAGLWLDLTDSNGNDVFSSALGGVYSNNMTITGNVNIDPSKVDLWWPNEMGDQPLYTAQVTITEANSTSTSTSAQRRWAVGDAGVVATISRRVGFRTIVLNLTPISDADLAKGVAPGANWHFEINGQPFYAKGSNLVPINVLWASVNTTYVQQLFELATDAHFNMFRVWASGVYQADWIYDLADEMGILLWSEFEFTDAEYSAAPEWEAVYEREAYYNTRRVNHHPSLALWAGGNELESIQLAFFFNATSPTPIMQDYQETFERTLIKCVYANSKSISYIPSSTYNGYLSLNFSSDRPQLPRYKNTSGIDYIYGDTDSYGSGDQAFNLSSYAVGRFADEFGFISMPGIESWEDVGTNITSFTDPVVVYHNRHSGGSFGQTVTQEEGSLLGIAQMTDAVQMYYPAPAISDPRANFSAWIWSSEVFQSDFYTSQIAFYRRGSGRPERQLGSLYWQFNDVWVAPTWSSVPHNLKAKVTQYAVKDIYNPVIIRPYFNETDGSLEVWVTSDLFNSIDGTVEYDWMTWSGDSVDGLNSSSASVHVEPVNATQVLRYDNVLETIKSKANVSDVVMRLQVTAGNESHVSYYHPAYLVNSTLVDPKLTLTSSSNTFTVQASAVAAWVTLDYSAHQVQGHWSDNGFWLRKGESRTVTFNVWNDWTGDGSWTQEVSVRSMWDNVAGREYAATLG